jgi:hypothetical protein
MTVLRYRLQSGIREGNSLSILSKIFKVLGTIIAMLILAVIGLIVIFDPPPFQLQEASEFVLSVPPPHTQQYPRSNRNGSRL